MSTDKSKGHYRMCAYGTILRYAGPCYAAPAAALEAFGVTVGVTCLDIGHHQFADCTRSQLTEMKEKLSDDHYRLTGNKLGGDTATAPVSLFTANSITRSVEWRWRSEERMFGILRIKIGTAQFDYFVTKHGGAVYTLTKLVPGATVTFTCVVPTEEHANHRRCGCDGWKSARTCTHIDALLFLREQHSL